jgi:hypothetical protein
VQLHIKVREFIALWNDGKKKGPLE